MYTFLFPIFTLSKHKFIFIVWPRAWRYGERSASYQRTNSPQKLRFISTQSSSSSPNNERTPSWLQNGFCWRIGWKYYWYGLLNIVLIKMRSNICLSNYSFAEEILREIFERCGSILTIRMSKKNFAHVRFERECYVDSAIVLSGEFDWTVKLDFC